MLRLHREDDTSRGEDYTTHNLRRDDATTRRGYIYSQYRTRWCDYTERMTLLTI
ncbi:hypothetical protein DPMN_056850 [Dreissena polymorpha]|uniref:Uncharacterized protein n=1 Tax=Dreissena polymorpha TaxID=45954 RepID=A0A9D4CV58_DREPO|nr:hypothetical protein DPMN_056850 [Dreissena polymorpha]